VPCCVILKYILTVRAAQIIKIQKWTLKAYGFDEFQTVSGGLKNDARAIFHLYQYAFNPVTGGTYKNESTTNSL
jgi:hypothetical protein